MASRVWRMRPVTIAIVGGAIALAAGGALMRLWDHRAGPSSRPEARSQVAPHFARVFHASHFVRGNLHTHTTRSDGDASPEDVIRWYRDHGYGFLALTDHNLLSEPDVAAAFTTPEFALVPGEEVTMWALGKPIHVNALCTHTVVPGGRFLTKSGALESAITAIVADNGVALVNHPNFEWALTAADVMEAKGAALLEVASGHPYVRTLGDANHPSHEQIWDDVLTRGFDMMGVAVDDMHHLVTEADPEAYPGRAWVQVIAGAPRVDDVCDALRRGALYASTGAELRGFDVEGVTYTVTPVDPDATVVFVGSGGRLLGSGRTGGGSAHYALQGDEGYVRARVESSRGSAWTPAVRVTRDAD